MSRTRGLGGLAQRIAITDLTAPQPTAVYIAPIVYTAGSLLVLVADSNGVIIGKLPCEVDGMAWKLNNYSQARLAASPQVNERLIKIGNRILILSDSGLKPWGGVLDLPRDRRPSHVELTAFSGEYLLSLRQTERSRPFSNATAGEIIRSVLQEANAIEFSGVSPGAIFEGGTRHGPEYHWKTILEVLQDSLQRMTTVDFDVTALESGGKIVFNLNLYEVKGSNKENIWLVQGRNIAPAGLKEQGPLINRWQTAGSGNSWGDLDRVYATAEDSDSRNKYGLREGSEIFNGVTVQTTIDAHADANLLETKEPRPILSLDALNLSPALWGQYDVGDIVNVDLPSYGERGYQSTARVLAMEFLPSSGILRLVVD